MTFRSSTAVTATLLAGLLLAGSLGTAHAGDGCGSDKKKDAPTSSQWTPLEPTREVRTAWA